LPGQEQAQQATAREVILRLPRPGGGTVSVKSEHVLAWAPTSDIGKDKAEYTDVMFPGTKLTVHLAYEEMDRIMGDAE
jgi:hypothetical protein